MEWYRRKSWKKKDKEEFFNHLNRARKYNRAQYLKVQAIELIDTNDPKLLEIAKSLLVQILEEYSEENNEISSVLNSLGDIYRKQTNYEKALNYYKKSIDFEEMFPNVRTDSYLKYSELIIKSKQTDKYMFVKELILKHFDSLIFPVEKYKTASILSIINKEEGNIESAAIYKNFAEENANKENSGFRYHKYLGVVNKRDKWLDKLVKSKKNQ
ncbi:tetratricopeptide repeat protein [uncultured Christiangramia sp.]|uniref:tetratricopeptide repeat protein n=1 Tax=uncultured Christiangramia sp. TaxID=503836 RepID=UPI002626E76E|nr:tetratricopeptide repeat protein [uncultured Christiangramia sp.]